jgi:hypothetical protein
VGDTISLLKFWNEHWDQDLSSWAQLIDLNERGATQLAKIAAGPKCPVADWPSSALWATKQPGFLGCGKQPSSIPLAIKGCCEVAKATAWTQQI